MVTLGCARNEVDSEELAGRLEAGGFVLVADAEDADTVVVNTCGFVEAAKKDSVDTLLEAADLKASPGTAAAPRPSSRWAAWPRGTARTSPSRCPRPTRCSASTTTPTSRPSCARSWRGRPTTRTRRPTAGGCCRSRRSTATPPGSPSRAPGPARGRRRRRDRCRCARDGPPRRTPSPRRRPDGAAQAGQRLRPALLLLRDPELPRLLRQPPSQRRAAGGPVAGHAGRQGALPRQRELHVLRQGPRRPPAARDAAARAVAASTASSGCGCPTSSPPRPGPA